MSDWQVGDLAVCINAGPLLFNGRLSNGGGLLVEGRTYRVVALIVREDQPWAGIACLVTDDADGHDGFATCRFRKIRPDEHEACEPEFVTLLKRNKVSA
jgi:hypothetical protein